MSAALDIDPLDLALAPVAEQLAHPGTEDLAFNRPGEAWWYINGGWRCIEVPAMTYRRLHGVAVLAASQGRQTIGPRAPILATDLPNGHRLHAVLHPAVPEGNVALVFRRPGDSVAEASEIAGRFDVSRWNRWRERKERRRADSAVLLERFDAGDIEGFLRGIASTRRTPIFGGATGAGKSYLMKTYLSLLPLHARILTIEDAKEAVIRQPNHVRLMFGPTVTQLELLKTLLRMRPDYGVVGELRDADSAWVYANEAMAGHPGSPTTIHGKDAPQIAKRLFNLVKGSAEGRSVDDRTIVDLLAAVVDVIVPIANDGGARAINEVWFADDAERRGEGFADLLREV